MLSVSAKFAQNFISFSLKFTDSINKHIKQVFTVCLLCAKQVSSHPRNSIK